MARTSSNIAKNLGSQRLASLMIIFTLAGFWLYIGRVFLLPLAFGFLFALLLRPVAAFLEKYIRQRHTAILLSFLLAFIPILAAVFIFSYQLTNIISNIPSISSRITAGLNQSLHWLQERTHISMAEGQQWILDNFSTLIDTPLEFLATSFTSSTSLLAGLLIATLITFFMLLYRTSFQNFFLVQFQPGSREEARSILSDIQQVVQQYLYGMLLVILILGVVNGLGLWLIGIRHAFFWGFLAAFLAIIPYIGTTLGGVFPFLYALATTTTIWQPAAVVALYVTVQSIEGNFITPKVVGGSVNINPLVAILSLFFWGLLWGIAGLILALPIMAIIKVTMSHVDVLKPLSELLSDHLYRKKDIFLEKYDSERFRLSRFLTRQE